MGIFFSTLTTNLVSLLPLAFPAFLQRKTSDAIRVRRSHRDGCGLRGVQAGHVGPRVQHLATWPGDKSPHDLDPWLFCHGWFRLVFVP